jgi:hypothetical protein
LSALSVNSLTFRSFSVVAIAETVERVSLARWSDQLYTECRLI